MTGLTISTSKKEFSRFEPSRSTVSVRIVPEPKTGLVDEPIKLTMARDGGPVIYEQETTLTGDFPSGIIHQIDLKKLVDGDGIPTCRRGDYTITVMSGDVSASRSVRVSLITVEEMRNTYCFGAPLYASDTMSAKRQPVLVAGVTIDKVSENTRKGVYALAYDADNRTLSWGQGTPIPIGGDTEILLDNYGGYAEVSIDEFLLPEESASEGIVIDKKDMDDEAIRSEIDKAIADIETKMKFDLEPTRIATEPFFSSPEDGEHFDRLAPAFMFTRRDFNLNGLAWHLDIPVQQLLKIESMVGYLGNTKALEISSGAFAIQKKTGQVDVLPYDSSYSYLYTFFIQLQFWGVREYVADFWRYKAVAGLPECPADVLKLVAYSAAISILTIAGQAYRGGFSSESVSKDGVSRSVSYTASATYGVYSASINEFKEWIKANEPRIRAHYRGIQMVVL